MTANTASEIKLPETAGDLDGHNMTVLLRYGTKEGETGATVSALLQDLRENLATRGADALGCVVFDHPMCVIALAVKAGSEEWPPERFAYAFHKDDRIVVLRGPHFERVCETLAASMNDAIEAGASPELR